MKKAIINLLFILFLIPITTQAKVWRVNSSISADFGTLDAAMVSYANNDTLYLEPSATNYTISNDILNSNTRLVTIIGNGYNLTDNSGLQANTLSSIISATNSTGLFIRSNIKFVGITFASQVLLDFNPGGNNRYENVAFESCLFKNSIQTISSPQTFINNLHFTKNYFLNSVVIRFSTSFFQSITNFVFENNIATNDFVLDGDGLNTSVKDKLIRNNVFLGSAFCNLAYLANNIFATPISGTSTFNLSIFNNNLIAGNTDLSSLNFVSFNNNLINVDPSNVFQNFSLSTKDKSFQLKAGSPAIGAGIPNGSTPVDCGAFGGPNPYKLSGIPAIPSIYELQAPSSVRPGNDMQINLKSRSNN